MPLITAKTAHSLAEHQAHLQYIRVTAIPSSGSRSGHSALCRALHYPGRSGLDGATLTKPCLLNAAFSEAGLLLEGVVCGYLLLSRLSVHPQGALEYSDEE